MALAFYDASVIVQSEHLQSYNSVRRRKMAQHNKAYARANVFASRYSHRRNGILEETSALETVSLSVYIGCILPDPSLNSTAKLSKVTIFIEYNIKQDEVNFHV